MIKLGIWIVALSYAPILLYVLLGPADGNPIGLGMLTIIGNFAGAALIVFGIVLVLVRRRTL
ncbi:hypothetical protein [Pelagibius sp. Alg239-R121]|uniref:hypothetical protein n=1 Tax=Pelagibius sp. Alg239-R121 TaxID=2993448 RepID=UPI0024A6F37C|nr:hypothetical protein [Pelagibius sp. Alg239-R121]